MSPGGTGLPELPQKPAPPKAKFAPAYQNEDGYGRAWGAAFRRFAFARPYGGGVRFELYCRVRF